MNKIKEHQHLKIFFKSWQKHKSGEKKNVGQWLREDMIFKYKI